MAELPAWRTSPAGVVPFLKGKVRPEEGLFNLRGISRGLGCNTTKKRMFVFLPYVCTSIEAEEESKVISEW